MGSGYKVENWNICENDTGVSFLRCFEEITFSAKEIIPQYIVGNEDYYSDYYATDYEDEDLRVKNYFDLFGGLAKSVEINNTKYITHDQFSTLSIVLNENITYETYFMDKKMQYVFGSPNIIPRPVLTFKQNAGELYIYLKVIRHEKLNQPHNPCDPSPDYDFTTCLEKSLISKVGCQPPWRRFVMEKKPLCDNLSLLHDYGNEMDRFTASLGKNELFEETSCLMPCSFMEYRVSFKICLTQCIADTYWKFF